MKANYWATISSLASSSFVRTEFQMNSEDHRHTAQAALNNLKPWLSESQITLWQTLWTWQITWCPCFSFPTTQMVISKHYVTLRALSETVMSFHGDYILLQGSPDSAKRILWALLSSFVSINCPFNLMVSLNIILLCQTEMKDAWSKPILQWYWCVHVCLSCIPVPHHPAPKSCGQWNRKGNKDSGSFRER